ncbi:hypothetical protein ACFVVM_12435 [Nocardia sp. NPDC058176]
MLPHRIPEAVEPPTKTVAFAPPEIIRRLLVALAQFEQNQRAS